MNHGFYEQKSFQLAVGACGVFLLKKMQHIYN